MTELNQAAERLRQAIECDEFSNDISALLATDVDPQLPRDLLSLANAYLDEHLPDDDEPITREWCVSTYFAQRDENNVGSRVRWMLRDWFICIDFHNAFVINQVHPETNQLSIHNMKCSAVSIDWRNIKTRGQLRQLLKALQ